MKLGTREDHKDGVERDDRGEKKERGRKESGAEEDYGTLGASMSKLQVGSRWGLSSLFHADDIESKSMQAARQLLFLILPVISFCHFFPPVRCPILIVNYVQCDQVGSTAK